MTGGSRNALNRQKPSARPTPREVHGSRRHDDPPSRPGHRGAWGTAGQCGFGCRPVDGPVRARAGRQRLPASAPAASPPPKVPVRAARPRPGRGGRTDPVPGRCGERVRAVDQQCRRAGHPRLRRLLLIGDLPAADHDTRVAGQRGCEPLLEHGSATAQGGAQPAASWRPWDCPRPLPPPRTCPLCGIPNRSCSRHCRRPRPLPSGARGSWPSTTGITWCTRASPEPRTRCPGRAR
jgi:hypothetical protein